MIWIVFSLDEYQCNEAVLGVFDNESAATTYAIDLMEWFNESTRIVSRPLNERYGSSYLKSSITS